MGFVRSVLAAAGQQMPLIGASHSPEPLAVVPSGVCREGASLRGVSIGPEREGFL